MKKVEAILEPAEIEEVAGSLIGMGIRGIAVTEVKCFGGPAPAAQIYRAMRCEPPFVIEARMEVVVADEIAEKTVAFISKKAKTDESGESRIFVYSLDNIVTGRTETKGAEAA